MFFESCIGFILSSCVNEKNMYMFFKSSVEFGLSNCLNAKKNTFEMRNTQYRIKLSVHKQPSAFNITYTIQCRVNCPSILKPVF